MKQQLFEAGFMCDVDVDDSDTMNKKIRNAQLAQYNFIMGMDWNLQHIFFFQLLHVSKFLFLL